LCRANGKQWRTVSRRIVKTWRAASGTGVLAFKSLIHLPSGMDSSGDSFRAGLIPVQTGDAGRLLALGQPLGHLARLTLELFDVAAFGAQRIGHVDWNRAVDALKFGLQAALQAFLKLAPDRMPAQRH